jgi:hypothetical protein
MNQNEPYIFTGEEGKHLPDGVLDVLKILPNIREQYKYLIIYYKLNKLVLSRDHKLDIFIWINIFQVVVIGDLDV